MNSNRADWPCARIIHLMGGARAMNTQGSQVTIIPDTTDGKIATFEGHSYEGLYSEIKGLGFSVVGVDFYTQPAETRGELPPNWRVYNQCGPLAWLTEEAAQKWKGIAHASFKNEEGHLWDLAYRIGHQLRVCSVRVRQLSEEYNRKLIAVTSREDVKIGKQFRDGFTMPTYLAIKSFFMDACILRDYLSEFAAEFVFGPRHGVQVNNISTLSALLKKVIRGIHKNDSLASSIYLSASDGGWLKELGEYRDLALHSAPLEHAGFSLFALLDAHVIDAEGSIPILRISLPANPSDLSARRASRRHFSDFKELMDQSIPDPSSTKAIDALDYILGVQGKLADWAMTLSIESPVKYEPIVLTEEDFIDPPSLN